MIEFTSKGELLQFRAKIEEDIKCLNELARNTDDEIIKEVSRDVRDKLIEANNCINSYRLRHM